LICRLLRKREDPSNWSEYPNIAGEVDYLIDSCEWFDVYDIIEEIYHTLALRDEKSFSDDTELRTEHFSRELNKYFRRAGIGWQLVNGRLQIRGPESFENATRQAEEILHASGRLTASSEIHQALLDLSRRPDPDVTGSIQHAIAALECVARDVAGDPKTTLGELLKRHPTLIPAPLNQAVEKAWAYASDRARHLLEGRTPSLEEAELVVGIASVVATFLAKKAGGESSD
jgi:hypothetical protein